MPFIIFIIFIIVIVASAKSKDNEMRRKAAMNRNQQVNQGMPKQTPQAQTSDRVMPKAVHMGSSAEYKAPSQVTPQRVPTQRVQNRRPQPQRVQPQNCSDNKRCNEPSLTQNSSYSHRRYDDNKHPVLAEGQGMLGFRHESWIPVPRGYRVKECEYCGAANSIPMMGGEYKCYFCWKRL